MVGKGCLFLAQGLLRKKTCMQKWSPCMSSVLVEEPRQIMLCMLTWMETSRASWDQPGGAGLTQCGKVGVRARGLGYDVRQVSSWH